jgi:hypothetical protein
MKGDEGFNALTERYEDLVASGVIDPAEVVVRPSSTPRPLRRSC